VFCFAALKIRLIFSPVLFSLTLSADQCPHEVSPILSVGEDHARVHFILLKSVSLQMRLPTDRQPEHPGAILASHLGVFD
jgi:hypothetical protein